MICENCKKYCLCADCVRNPFYATNTPHPCIFGADCNICDCDMDVMACNQYLNLEKLNEKIQKNA